MTADDESLSEESEVHYGDSRNILLKGGIM